MSAKWRALQHRHRYTYNAVVFPNSYTESLLAALQTNPSSKFYAELNHLVSLNSIYSQINHAKKLASSFNDFLSNANSSKQQQQQQHQHEDSIREASRFYLELLFLENSQPLHKTLVSSLSKSQHHHSLIRASFHALFLEYAGHHEERRQKKKNRFFCASRVALSVLGLPRLGYLADVIEECALIVAYDVVSSLNSVVSETKDWARPSPIVMEQCQEALSCLYYLFQRFPSQLTDSNILEASLTVILSVLNSIAFSRDCFVAAGVCFFAALQVCLNPQQLALFIIRGIFNRITVNSVVSVNELRNVIDKVPYKGDLCDEIANFAVLSRLCLIRGVLTAVSRDVLNTRFDVERESDDGGGGGGNCVTTILYDGILPELCEYCENPSDSHFNFHALTVLQICLQQIKTSVLANISDPSGDYELITEEMGARIMRIVWNNLEDPLSQTVRQVHLVFDLFLDIQSSLCWSEGGERIKSFLEKITSYLLCLGPRCKGRYVPLASLTRRLGAKTMLEMSPDLLYETIQAYVDDDVCCAVTTFLKCFLEYLRDECWSSEGIADGYAVYRGNCLPPLLYGLGSGLSKLRSNLNTYALPVILEVDVDSIFTMLAFISIGPNGAENGLLYQETGLSNMELKVEQQVAILVSLFKVSRLLALIEGDIDWCKKNGVQDKEGVLGSDRFSCNALVCIKGIEVEVPVEWLVLALTHVDESLRVDAAESLFLNPKTSSLPSHLELTLMKEAVPLNMRCCSTAFQMKWSSLFRKFFSRVRTALERQFKQGSWQPLVYHGNTEVHFLNGSEETTVNRADDLFHFMRWFSSFLFFSCYPSAPYKRKIMAMDLFLIMLNVWSIVPSDQEDCRSLTPESCLYPYNKGITLPGSTLLLVGSIVDSWDRLRENSFRILLHFPTPLPGISCEGMVQKVIAWAKILVCSPRVRESDAGSLTLRFIFRKYVLELGWIVNVSINLVCFCSQPELVSGDDQTGKSRHPVIEYMKSLIDWLNVTVEEGERDLPEACKNSFVHGVLLALRYTFEELDWNSDVVLTSFLEMRYLLEKLLELIMRITSLALWVVSADAWYLPEDMDEMVDDDNFLFEVSNDVDVQAHSSDHEDKSSKVVQDARPSDQIVMVGCWLAMKEVSLLLGTIIRKIPLPSSGASDTLESGVPRSDADSSLMTESDAMLDVKQLEKIGSHFLEVLLKMKHNGAIDKTRAGFTALCNRLLCSNNPTLCKLTESWMEQLMERTVAKGQIVDDLLRRSAGIPAAFTALFLSEPEGAPKKLLPRALRWLIDVANGSLLNPNETNGTNGDSCIILSTKRNQETKSAMQPEIIESEKTSKIRHEGLVPTVHAFNVLRAAFNDTNLATDTSGFSAEALIISIRSFSSPYWEVRNSACLAYTALVRRMIGFLNIQKRESVRRALSGLEFFHRYPSLHTFVFNELKVATEMLGDVSSGHSESDLANVVHPSLCPLLILLSRLKPSTIASETGDELDPFLFMPFIRKCSTQSNLRVRVLASRALTGLVSNEKLPIVLHNIASELPFVENQLAESSVSSISLHMTLGSHHASFNSIHGMLLQLISLLDMNCRNLADFSKKDQILGDLIQVLVARSCIGSPRWCPCPILNTSFLRVLDHMLSIARTFSMSKKFYAIRNLLLKSSTECLDVEASYGLSYYDPTIAELREQAAMSYFSCVFQASKEVSEEFQMPRRCPTLDSKLLKIPEMENPFAGLQERLIRSLSDTSYEVRVTTLKWLLKFVKAIESGSEVHDLSSGEIMIIKNWTKTSLHETMIKLLDSEKNNRCTYYILRILFAWNLLQFQKHGDDKCTQTFYIGGMDYDSLFQFWDKLISLYKLTRHSKTRETLICCMGVCVKQFSGLFMSIVGLRIYDEHCQSDKLERSARLYDCIIFFTSLIKQHGASSEPVSMRKAAAESVIASGLLEQAVVIDSSVLNNQIPRKDLHSHFEPNEAVNMYAHQILDIWFTCIQLLEDEDDGIRQRLALDVQKCFTLERCGRCSHAGKVPNQVEKVIALCFDHLSSTFGLWIEYFDYLSQWVLNAASYAIPKGDLVRRVFDKEIDNHHEEKLLLSQICCSHLENLPVSKSWAVNFSDKEGMRSYLHNCRHRFCHQLISFAKDHVEKQGGADWIGGVGNHKDAFLPLYANLLGFYSLSNIILNEKAGDGRHLLSDVVELGRTITPFLRNPLIFNLYLLVVKLHEKNVSRIPDHLIPEFRDGCIWDSFEPYFLLR